MSQPPEPTGDCGTGLLAAINCGAGTGTTLEGQTANALFAAIGGSFASFGIQVLAFCFLRLRLSRIYRPRTYLVPEKERVEPPPGGFFGWIVPLFRTSNLSFIQKCGLDAYFFLRYLRMLLKIFLPIAFVVLPILLPLNSQSGDESKGLDVFSISNISPRFRGNRYWAHLLLAVAVISWVCYVVFKELRGYIRVRQAFLTSPQHRIRASATTVLVTGIPHKWLTVEALNGLYDIFPGGIRNIWINRNYDELADKINYRDSLAQNLEDAETVLIKKCRIKHAAAEKKKRKDEGQRPVNRKEKQNAEDDAAEKMAKGQGISAGDQHQIPHGLHDALRDAEQVEKREDCSTVHKRTDTVSMLGHGLGNLGHGLGQLGKGVAKVADDVGDGIFSVAEGVDDEVKHANRGHGFVLDNELYESPARTTAAASRAGSTGLSNRRPVASQGSRQLVSSLDPGSGNPTDGSRAPGTSQSNGGSRMDEKSHAKTSNPSIVQTTPDSSPRPLNPAQTDGSGSLKERPRKWQFWKKPGQTIPFPSPQPLGVESNDFPLNAHTASATSHAGLNQNPEQNVAGSRIMGMSIFRRKRKDQAKDASENPDELEAEYPQAFDKDWDEDQDGGPRWGRYLAPKDRETMRVPIFSPTWCPSLPLLGKKVDRIYYLRRELAKMNLEIEMDQDDVEKFPLMKSAFIQFNHQVAAHMACQALSHHVPQHMAPRLVEMSPDDVLWDNMALSWWERYLRTGVVLALCLALIIFYAIPVTFTSLLSKVSILAQAFPKALGWLGKLPDSVKAIIQGLGPAIVLAVILIVVPIIFRLLIKQNGVPTGNLQELGVQRWYFAFLFIQVFLVVTITGGLTEFVTDFAINPTGIVTSLARNLPSAANYFFNYLTVQALSTAATNLLQAVALFGWFVLGPMLDSTARAKWSRQTTLASVQWGTFFPPFTNFAVIGLVYSVISPLIIVFMLLIFSFFWVVFRYNVLYVYQFRKDTGGLLFPTAVNQLFLGIYTAELCLIGYFFISLNEKGQVACIPQAGIMVVVLFFTLLYQYLLKSAFEPLFRYLPITLEDEAVIRDEEFARAQASKFATSSRIVEEDDRDIQEVLQEREQKEEESEQAAAEQEKHTIEERRRSLRRGSSLHSLRGGSSMNSLRRVSSMHSASPAACGRNPWRGRRPSHTSSAPRKSHEKPGHAGAAVTLRNLVYEPTRGTSGPTNTDVEAQRTVGDVLFSGFADELEDLTPEERDRLVRYAFQHSALRAKRPVVWIPRDALGVSDDEIRRTQRMSTVTVEDTGVEKTNIWISNEGTALNGRGKVVFRRSPPDFSNVDLIAL